MRYLSNRDQFLRNSKFSGLEKYETTPYSGEKFKINEASSYATNHGAGPFHNDIGWNDSLVGRFINHLIRKARILVGGLQMKGLISRLNRQFDQMVEECIVMSADDDTKSMIAKVTMYSFFWELTYAVENGAQVSILKEITQNSINALDKLDDFDEKDTLEKELKDFLEFLNQFEDSDGGEGQGEEGEGEEDGEGQGEEDGEGQGEGSGSEAAKKAYPQMIKNLKALSMIINKVSTMKVGTEVKKVDKKIHKTVAGETVGQIAKKNNITSDVIWNKNANTKVDNKGTTLTQWLTKSQSNSANKGKDKNDIALPQNVSLLLERVITVPENIYSFLEKNDPFAGNRGVKDPKQRQQQQAVKSATKQGIIAGGQTAKEIGFEDRHTKEAFEKLKNAVTILTNKDFYSVTSKFIDDIAQNTKGGNLDPVKMKNIKKLYNEINIYYRDNKSQLDSLSGATLYKESVEELGKNIKSVAKKIAIFSVTIMKFKGENLSLSKDLNTAIKDFISSFEIIRQAPITEPEKVTKKDVEEKKNDSFISKYDSFLKLIKEADETEDEEDDDDLRASDPPTGSTSEKINDFFDKNCKGVKAFTVDKTEVEKIRKNIEKIDKDKVTYYINGFDPIIEIIRLFNRAYKLYVHTVISKRSKSISGGDAGPSPGTLMEYTPMGGSGQGPWRNNKLFNQWENAVFDILGNRKYQYLFNKETKLRLPLVPNPKSSEDIELRDNAGANLRKFMTEILDGDSLYSFGGGSGAQGAQAKLLEKYFGEPDDKAVSELQKIDNDPQTQENENNSKKIREGAKKLKFKKMDAPIGQVGQVFAIIGKNKDNEVRKRFFFVLEAANGGRVEGEARAPFILAYTYGLGPIWSLLKQSGNLSIDKGEFPDALNENQVKNMADGGKDYSRNITKSKQNLNVFFKAGKKINLNHIVAGSPKNVVEEEITITSVYFLNDEEGLYRYDADKINAFKIGFKVNDFKSYVNSISDKAVISNG